MAELKSSRPPTRNRRVKSAIARISPVPEVSSAHEQIAKLTKERVNSAKTIKSKHTSSHGVFAAKQPEAALKGRFTTMYTQDFDGTYVPPSEIRPTSSTRRNNPHPSKQFMKWKIPSREVGAVPYEEGLELPPEYLAQNEEFDAIEDMSGNLGALKLPPTMATSTEYGAYLRRKKLGSRQDHRRPYIKEDALGRVLTDGNNEALTEWLQGATLEEQQTVAKMLKSAEEEQIKHTISNVMQPQAAKAVHGWLKDADDKERDVAVRLFSSLGSRQGGRRQRSLSEGHISLDPRPPSRMLPPTLPPPRPPNSRMGSRPNTRSRQVSDPSKPPYQQPWPAGIWHHKPVRDPPPNVYHRGSLFGTVREDASHFKVHPEWQDYFANGGDYVH